MVRRPLWSELDLNQADSMALMSQRAGIGPWSARAIRCARERDGAIFPPVAQLRKNIRFALTPVGRRSGTRLFYVVPRPPPELNLNSKHLRRIERILAGFRFHQVKRIVFYRERFGPVHWRELASWEEFSDVDTTFLQHYVSE